MTFFKFAGSLTTGMEVVGLALDAYFSDRMGPFNAFSRYLTVGFLEVFLTFQYISQCYADLEKNYNWLVTKNRFVQLLYKLWINIKYSPLFVMGFMVTFTISLMYLESKNSLILKATGNPLFPKFWEFITIEMVKSPDMSFINSMAEVALSDTPQFAAFTLIYFTPFITLMLAITLAFTPLENIMDMLKKEKFLEEKLRKEAEEDEEHRRRNRKRRSSGGGSDKSEDAKSRTEDSTEDNTNSEEGDDAKKLEGEPKEESSPDIEDTIIQSNSLLKYLNTLNNAFKTHSAEFDVDDYVVHILACCGISHDGSVAEVSDRTHESVEDYINSGGSRGVSPKDYYSKTVIPIVKGSKSLIDKGVPNGYLGYQAISQKYSKAIETMKDAQSAYEVARNQYDTSKTPQNKQELEEAKSELSRVKLVYDQEKASFNKDLKTIIEHFKNTSETTLGYTFD